jgi:hypothetical protein
MKMKKLTLLITILLFVISKSVTACDCGSDGNFMIVAPNADLVALIKVTKYLSYKSIYEKEIPMSMEVEMIKTYKGKEDRKSFIVWGDNGILCRPYLSQFDTGKYYVIAFIKGVDGSKGHVHESEKTTDYAISNCGNYWLTANMETKKAFGLIAENKKEITFEKLNDFFFGEKTDELTAKDFLEIYQLALNLPQLQQYYHTNKNKARKQVYIKYFGEAKHNNLLGVTKFGKQVKILTEKEIKTQKIKNYFVLGDWVCGLNSVRMQLSYVGEGLTVSCMFKKINEKWTIVSSAVFED